MDFKSALRTAFEKPYQLVSCHEFETWFEDTDFTAIEGEIARLAALPTNDQGKTLLGDGFEIRGETAFISLKGFLVPNLGMDLSAWGLTGYDVVGDYIEYANAIAKTQNITEIKLKVDSGGGYTQGISELVDIMEASDLPISTLVTGMAASAAYWIGCTSENIDAVKGAGPIGSIGVRATHVEVSERLKNMGVKKQTFTSGFWKDAYADHKPLSKRAARELQKTVDDEALDFFNHVANYRDEMTSSDVKDLEANTFNLKKALQLGLIDSIGEDKSQHEQETTGSNAMANEAPTGKDVTMTAQEAEELANAKAEAAVKKAMDARDAEDAKTTARTKLVNDHECKHENIKTILTGSGFASVSDEDMTALLDAMPKGLSAQMDETGGAGVGAAPQELSEDDAKKAKEAKAARTKETQAALKNSKINLL